MAETPKIEGLPAGAELRPIEGLPPGAELRPVAGAAPTEGISQKPAQPGMLEPHGGPMDLLRGAGAGISQILQHPIDTLKGMAQPVADMLPAYHNGPMGIPIPVPNTQGAANNMQQGEATIQAAQAHPYHFAGQILGPAAATAGIAKFAPMAMGAMGKALPSASAPTAWETAANADKPWLKLASKVGPTGASQKTLGVVPALADDLKGIVPQLGRTGARTPLEFSKAVEDFQKNVAGPEYGKLRDPFAQEKLGVQALQGTNAAEFKLANGKTLGPNPTIAETEQALREANQIAGPGYQAATNTFDRQSMMNAQDVAARLRTSLNSRIAELARMEPSQVGSLRERIGQAGNIAGNAAERSVANTLGIDSAPSVAMKAGMARSMPARAIRAAVVEPMENWQFRRALNAVQPRAAQFSGPPPLPSNLESLTNLLNVGGGGSYAGLAAARGKVSPFSLDEYLKGQK